MKSFKRTAILFVFAAVAALCIFAACGPTDKHTHTIDFVERAATCTEQGLAAHYECVGDDGCGKFFADAEGLTEITVDDIEHTDALGHTGGTAKCNALAVCTRCGNGYGEYGEHDYSGGFVKSAGGGHYLGCAVCGEIKEGAEIISHEYGERVVDEEYLKSEATCRSKPVYHKTCVCGAFEENGETFTYGEFGDHDYKWTSDENSHWKECKTEGCTAAHTDEGAHIFPTAYTVTETGHYKECVCGRHTDEGEHSYTEEAKNDKYIIREPSCTQTALYHKSCVCGSFEENGDTFETGTGTHSYEWKSDATLHWQYCPVCLDETEKTEHSHNRLVVRVEQGKSFKEDDEVNPEDYEVYNVCECGDETECNEAFTVVNDKYVRDENTITVRLDSSNRTAKVTVTAIALPRYTLTLVGASYNGENKLQLKEGEKLPALTPQEGKTFAGYYYDDSFKVYYDQLPADYNDTHITIEKLSDFAMPAYAYKLTAMLYENMPYVVPSDYQDDGSTGAKGKVASHVEVGGKIVTRFEWETSQKGRVYKVRPNNDTKSHYVNVANPAVNPKEGDKSLMLVGITNNGNEAVTIRYQTENWGYKGDMTVTVGAKSTVIVPFIYNFYHMDNGNNRGTCWGCDQCIAVTSNITQKAQLDVFGYIVADGNIKPVRLDVDTPAVMIEKDAQTVLLSGNLVVDLKSGISLKVYDEVDVSTATKAHGGMYLKFNAYGQEKTVPMFIKNERSDYNRFVLVQNDDCNWLSGEWDYTVPDADIATKFTFKTDVTNSAEAATLASWKWNEWAKKNGYNVKVPGHDGVTRDIELRFINHSDEEIKLYVYADDYGDKGGVHITLKKSSEVSGEQVFKFTRNNIGLNYGTNYMIKMEGNASAGSSFSVYGWYKACKEDIGVGMKIKDSNHKTSFKVGEKFDSSKLRLMFDVRKNDNDNNPNIVNYVTDYDGYTFTQNDVGKHTVTVYWYGNTVTYDITVSE